MLKKCKLVLVSAYGTFILFDVGKHFVVSGKSIENVTGKVFPHCYSNQTIGQCWLCFIFAYSRI